VQPKQLIGRYAARDPDWWRTADLKELDALWGGETAAAIETGYLEPEIAAVYIEQKLNELVLRLKLKRDPQGKVEIFRKFWKFRLEEQRGQTVPLPLIYADLLAAGNDRNIRANKAARQETWSISQIKFRPRQLPSLRLSHCGTRRRTFLCDPERLRTCSFGTHMGFRCVGPRVISISRFVLQIGTNIIALCAP
jgi:hypothetical protein